jgi:hypothetical protein
LELFTNNFDNIDIREWAPTPAGVHKGSVALEGSHEATKVEPCAKILCHRDSSSGADNEDSPSPEWELVPATGASQRTLRRCRVKGHRCLLEGGVNRRLKTFPRWA